MCLSNICFLLLHINDFHPPLSVSNLYPHLPLAEDAIEAEVSSIFGELLSSASLPWINVIQLLFEIFCC